MSANAEMAGDEREGGGSDEEERDGAYDGEEGESGSSHWGRSTEWESSSAAK